VGSPFPGRPRLPPKISDEAVLMRIITLAFTGLPDEQPEQQADGDGRSAR
jgi:hypothetical protein